MGVRARLLEGILDAVDLVESGAQGFLLPMGQPAGKDEFVVVAGRIAAHAEIIIQLLELAVHLLAAGSLGLPVIGEFFLRLRGIQRDPLEFLFQVFDDLIGGADRGRDTQPFKIEAREDPVDLGGRLHRGEIHTPVILRVGNAGEKEDVWIVVVGFELFKALLRQAAEPHLDGFAGEDVLELDIQPPEVLELFEVFGE